MPILTPTDSLEKVDVQLPKALTKRAKDYMTYANIQSLDEVFAKSLTFVFDNDKKFKKKERQVSKKKG